MKTLLGQLKRDEGYKPYAYPDSEGWLTIGYGTLIDKRKGGSIPEDIAELLLTRKVDEAKQALSAALPWTNCLEPARLAVLQNMAYNMGVGTTKPPVGLLGFKNTLFFIQTGDYASAAKGMLASKWARQVGKRATRLAKQMVSGEWQ